MASSTVERLVHELSRAYRLRRLLAGAARLAIGSGTVVACAAIAVPEHALTALWIAVALLATFVAVRAASLRLDPSEADRRLGLRGGLRTWFDSRRAEQPGPMLGWLERDLAGRIEATPVSARRRVGRRGLGAARSALIVLGLLLLLRLLVLPPLPDGVVPLAGRTGSAGAAAGAQDPGDDGTGRDPKDADPEPDTAPTDVPKPAGGPDPQDPGSEGPELPPEALVFEPPIQDAFVVPSFVGAGEGRETTAPAAGIDEGAPGAANPGAAAAGAGDGRDAPPPESRVEFERALEEALRSRHVPSEEREFVRRWFRSLLEGGR